MDYKTGDTVLYGSHGVCRITEITTRKFGADQIEYYILKPLYDERATIYVPLGNRDLLNKMQRILSEEEVMDALEAACAAECVWTEDDTERKIKQREIIDSGVLADIISTAKSLYLHRERQEKCGKKLRIADERALKEVEKIIFDELSLVLGISREAARRLLEDKLNI